MIWPWWVRLSHWLVACGICLLWVLTYGYYETDTLHRWLGYAVLGLVAMRLLLAKVTAVPAAKLVLPSKQQLRAHFMHLKQLQLPTTFGHNPLGQLAVYVMWTLIALLALTGWISRTDTYWGEDWPVNLHAWLSMVLMMMVVAHVLAVIVVSRLSRQRLVLQMLDGKLHCSHSQTAQGSQLNNTK